MSVYDIDGKIIGSTNITDVKDQILDCFENNLWIGNDANTYYNSLRNAFYPNPEPAPVSEWDYEWYSTSKTLPQGFTAKSYNFVREDNVLFADFPYLDLNYSGYGILEIECKWLAYSTNDGSRIYDDDKPLIILANGQNGVIVTGNASSNDSGLYVKISASSAPIVTSQSSNTYHKIDIISSSSGYSVTIDDAVVATGSGVTLGENNRFSGIYSGSYDSLNTYIHGIYIKSLKLKKTS